MAGVVVTGRVFCAGAGFVVLLLVLVAFEFDDPTGAKCVVIEGVDGFGGSGRKRER